MENEQQVKQWVERVARVTFIDTEWWNELKNGKILCGLMEALNPGSIPCVYDSNAEFLVRRNIQFFLNAAEEFGVPRTGLFSVSDLRNGENIPFVIQTIHDLSTIPHDRKIQRARRQIITSTKSLSPEQFNLLLESVKASSLQTESNPVPLSPIARLTLGRSVLCALEQTPIPPIVRIQSVIRRHLVLKQYRQKVRNLAYRQRVAREILQTEENYVEALRMCVELYLNPLQAVSGHGKLSSEVIVPSVSKKDIRAIFSDLAVIQRFHETSILEKIRPRVENWQPYVCLGDIFLEIMSFMKIYTQYVQNYSTSMTVCERLRQTLPKFQQFLNDRQAIKRTKGQTLGSFLIMPIQRIPRYHLLLSDLCKHTWPEHPDYSNLMKAAEQLQTVTDELNNKKKQVESLQRVSELTFELRDQLKHNLFEPHRKLVLEEKLDNITLLLFNDLLLILITKNNNNNNNRDKRKSRRIRSRIKESLTTSVSDELPKVKLQYELPLSVVKLVPIDEGFTFTVNGNVIYTAHNMRPKRINKWINKFQQLTQSSSRKCKPSKLVYQLSIVSDF